MADRFAPGGGTIVTGTAIIHDARMIKHSRGKIAHHMTHAAILCGWQVACGFILPMTTGAVTGNATVIKCYISRKAGGSMA